MCEVLNIRKVGWNRGVYVGRRRGVSMHFGNPFVVGTHGAQGECVSLFEQWLDGSTHQHIEPERRQWILSNLHTLRDQDLSCWCSPASCHADVLMRLAND